MLKQINRLEAEMTQLMKEFSVDSEYYMSELKIAKDIYYQGPSNFTFSNLLKNEWFSIQAGGSIVTRTSP